MTWILHWVENWTFQVTTFSFSIMFGRKIVVEKRLPLYFFSESPPFLRPLPQNSTSKLNHFNWSFQVFHHEILMNYNNCVKKIQKNWRIFRTTPTVYNLDNMCCKLLCIIKEDPWKLITGVFAVRRYTKVVFVLMSNYT